MGSVQSSVKLDQSSSSFDSGKDSPSDELKGLQDRSSEHFWSCFSKSIFCNEAAFLLSMIGFEREVKFLKRRLLLPFVQRAITLDKGELPLVNAIILEGKHARGKLPIMEELGKHAAYVLGLRCFKFMVKGKLNQKMEDRIHRLKRTLETIKKKREEVPNTLFLVYFEDFLTGFVFSERRNDGKCDEEETFYILIEKIKALPNTIIAATVTDLKAVPLFLLNNQRKIFDLELSFNAHFSERITRLKYLKKIVSSWPGPAMPKDEFLLEIASMMDKGESKVGPDTLEDMCQIARDKAIRRYARGTQDRSNEERLQRLACRKEDWIKALHSVRIYSDQQEQIPSTSNDWSQNETSPEEAECEQQMEVAVLLEMKERLRSSAFMDDLGHALDGNDICWKLEDAMLDKIQAELDELDEWVMVPSELGDKDHDIEIICPISCPRWKKHDFSVEAWLTKCWEEVWSKYFPN